MVVGRLVGPIVGQQGVPDRLQLAMGEPHHFRQQPAVAKTGNLSLAEAARLVVDPGLDDLEILFGGRPRAGCLQPDAAMTFVDATDLRVC